MLIDLQPRGLLLLCCVLPDAPALSSLPHFPLQSPVHGDVPRAPTAAPALAQLGQPHASFLAAHFLELAFIFSLFSLSLPFLFFFFFLRQVPGLAVLATKDL